MAKQLNLRDFELRRNLGRGTFATVKLAKFKGDGKQYVVKSMSKHKLIELRQVEHINNEKRLLASIDYPFIVKMIGYAKDDKYVHIMMELISGGDLFIHVTRARKFSADKVKFFTALMGAALTHLHSRSIVFRDLKPENVLMMSNGYAKLADFGYARIIEKGTSAYTLCGTPDYIAPEVLLNKGYDKSADWWSFGVLIYEMMVGQAPFCDNDTMGIYDKVLTGRVYFPTYFQKHAKQLVRKLMQRNPLERLGNQKGGHDDVLKHRFLVGMDYVKLEKFEVSAPYKPAMRDDNDVSNFEDVPPSIEVPPAVQAPKDPFSDW